MKKKKTENANKAMARKINFWHILGIVGLGFLGLGVAGGTIAGIRQAVIHAEKNKEFSVAFNLEEGKVKGKRGLDAVGMVAGINGEKNDFDNAFPWKGIKTVKDENGDYFRRVPKFYERINYKPGKLLEYSITSVPKKGYHVAPAFINGDEELDFVDIAKYEASIDKDGHLRSLPGVMPETAGHTLDQYRELAAADGNQLFNWRENQALQSLFVVEFATLDSQSIMAGETQYIAYTGTITADHIADKKLAELTLSEDEAMLIDGAVDKEKFAKANMNHIDIQMSFTDEDDEEVNFEKTVSAKKIVFNEDETVTITLNEAIDVSDVPADTGVTVAIGSYNYHKTGSTDKMKGSSGGASLKSLEVTGMNYRGVENWYGNTYTWCDGLATYQDGNGKYLCVSMDATKDNDRASYKKYSVTDMDATKALDDGIFFNQFDMDDEVTYQHDYFNFSFNSNTYYIGWVGGDFGAGSFAGAFYVYVYSVVSYAYYSVRLSCIPQAR